MNNFFKEIIYEYAQFPQVKAIGLGGSTSAKTGDNSSDLDIYIFTDEDILVEERLAIVKQFSTKYEVGGEYFGAGDEYFVDNLDKQFDVMFWNTAWFEGLVENTWVKNYPSNGYTTAFLYTLSNIEILHDKGGWLRNLKEKINTPYPAKLKANIIKRNMMLLKDKPFASYYEQIEKALKRNDINSLNHRITAFLASYFDVLFATNELLHPGEKRLIPYALEHCKKLPENFEEDINALLTDKNADILAILNSIVENLRKII